MERGREGEREREGEKRESAVRKMAWDELWRRRSELSGCGSSPRQGLWKTKKLQQEGIECDYQGDVVCLH